MKRERHALPWTIVKKCDIYFERYLQPEPSSPHGFVERRNLDHMRVSILMPSYKKKLADTCESKLSTTNYGEGSRSVYLLGLII